jgi:DNA-binding CsgD family transcriptional regulator
MADKVYPLSAREFEVVRLLADGLTNDELAAQLNLSRVEAARWFWRGRVATMVANGRH